MNKFTDAQFKKIESAAGYNVFQHEVNEHIVRLWAGDKAKSIPNIIFPSVAYYTHFEVKIFSRRFSLFSSFITYNNVNYYDVKPNKPWTQNSMFDLSRGLNQTVDRIQQEIDYISYNYNPSFKSLALEAPCKICQRNNDIGVSECWWCGCSNPC